jgi:hypothetical protein
MATFNLFLEASQADSAITNSYRLFHPNGLTGQSISLYGGNINHWGAINSTQLYITGDVGEESFINRLTGGIRVAGDCEFDKILNGVDIYGTSYIQTLTGGLNVTNGGANIVGNSVNNGSFRNVGNVSITGPTDITGATRIVGNTNIRGNFFQSGFFDVISNDAEFRGNLDVTGSLDVFGPLKINGNTTITATGGLTVSGPATVVGNSTLQGTTNIVGELQLNGQPFYTQQLNQTTEVNYFLTGGECVTLLDSAGAILTTSNTGLVPRNQGPTITGTTRGDYAVDLQLERSSITQVAKGKYSALIGGSKNTASGDCSVSIGGSGNAVSGEYSSLIGGSGNSISSTSYGASCLGGSSNAVNGILGSVIGGRFNKINNASSASIIGGSFNTGNAGGSVILGGNNNIANGNSSVCFGSRAKSANSYELVQGNGGGAQRHNLVGDNVFGNLPASFLNYIPIYFDNVSAPNSLLTIPTASAALFLKGYIIDTSFNSQHILEGRGYFDQNGVLITTTFSGGGFAFSGSSNGGYLEIFVTAPDIHLRTGQAVVSLDILGSPATLPSTGTATTTTTYGPTTTTYGPTTTTTPGP